MPGCVSVCVLTCVHICTHTCASAQLCVHVSVFTLVLNCSILNVEVMIQQEAHKKKPETQSKKLQSHATSLKTQSAGTICTFLTNDIPFLSITQKDLQLSFVPNKRCFNLLPYARK